MNLLYSCTILKIFYLTVSVSAFLSSGDGGGGNGGGGSRGGNVHYHSSFGGDNGGGGDNDSSSSASSSQSAVISLSSQEEDDDNKNGNNECGLLRIRLVDHDMVPRGGGGGGTGRQDSISSNDGGGGERYYYTPTTTIEFDDEEMEQQQQQQTQSDIPSTRNLPPGLIPFIKILSGVIFWNDSLQQFRRKFTVRYLKHQIGFMDDYYGDYNDDHRYVAVPDEILDMKPSNDNDDEIYQIVGYHRSWNIPEKHAMQYLGLGKNVPSYFIGSIKRTNTILQKEENCCSGSFLFGPIIKTIGNNNNNDNDNNNAGGGVFAIQSTLNGGILHGRTTMAGIDDLLLGSSNNNKNNHIYRGFGSACVDLTYRAMIGGSNDDGGGQEPFIGSGGGGDGIDNVIGATDVDDNRPSVTIRNQAVWGTQLQPRTDGNYFGFASRIRDYKEESKFDMTGSKYWDYKNIPPVSSYVRGTVQLSIPTSSLIRKSSLLCFADWSTSKSCRRLTSTVSNNNNNDMGGETNNNYHKTTSTAGAPANILQRGSIGCGFNLVPLKFRISYTQNGEFGMSFGLTTKY